jgi:PAS domain S-box-containing protein
VGARSDGVAAVLVVAWRKPEPPCRDGDAGYLKIAATLLANALADETRRDPQPALPDAIVASIAHPVVVVDRSGIIVSVNAAWTAFATLHRFAPPDSSTVGMSYLDLSWHAGAGRSAGGVTLKEAVEAVCRGMSDEFVTMCTCDLPGGERWWMITVTRLRHAHGGAVVEHVPLSHQAIEHLAQGIGNRLFERLADAAPVPIWISAADGTLLYANQHWSLSDGDGVASKRRRAWTDAIHPDDRRRVVELFRSALARREAFVTELRVTSTDGSYRWCSCRAAPRYTAAGELDSYVGVCPDATGQHQWETAFTHVAGKLVAAQESERIRIARELHDDLGQQTAVVASKLDMLMAECPVRDAGLISRIGEIQSGVHEMAVAIHTLSHQLHPAKLRLLGLVPTLDALCRDESTAGGVAVRFESTDAPGDLPEDTALCLFRVAQEAVRNATKHSGATHIEVVLSATGAQLVLEVSDNGAGFNPLAPSAGLGLMTMRERVQLVRGVLTVKASHPHGTTIRIAVPATHQPDATPHRPTVAPARPRAAFPAPPVRRVSASRGPRSNG